MFEAVSFSGSDGHYIIIRMLLGTIVNIIWEPESHTGELVEHRLPFSRVFYSEYVWNCRMVKEIGTLHRIELLFQSFMTLQVTKFHVKSIRSLFRIR
jgi:hypothetical protein